MLGAVNALDLIFRVSNLVEFVRLKMDVTGTFDLTEVFLFTTCLQRRRMPT